MTKTPVEDSLIELITRLAESLPDKETAMKLITILENRKRRILMEPPPVQTSAEKHSQAHAKNLRLLEQARCSHPPAQLRKEINMIRTAIICEDCAARWYGFRADLPDDSEYFLFRGDLEIASHTKLSFMDMLTRFEFQQ